MATTMRRWRFRIWQQCSQNIVGSFDMHFIRAGWNSVDVIMSGQPWWSYGRYLPLRILTCVLLWLLSSSKQRPRLVQSSFVLGLVNASISSRIHRYSLLPFLGIKFTFSSPSSKILSCSKMNCRQYAQFWVVTLISYAWRAKWNWFAIFAR